MSLVSVLRVIVLVLAAGPLVYYLLSLYCVIEYFVAMRKMPPRDDSFAPPVSILKAVRGVDHDAYENFASYCRLDYPEYELVFAMADRDDLVIPVIEKLKRDFPEKRIAFVTDVPSIGENNKVNSLCRLVKEAKHNLLVMTDSDVRVERDELMREPVWMVFPKERVGEFLRHELRWAIGLRNVRPAGYVGMIFTHGLPWAILAAVVAAASGWVGLAAAYLVAYLALRLGAAYAAGVWGLRDGNIAKKLWLAPLRDGISAAVWFAGFFTNKINWRGLEYRVKNRLLEPVGTSQSQALHAQERSARGVK